MTVALQKVFFLLLVFHGEIISASLSPTPLLRARNVTKDVIYNDRLQLQPEKQSQNISRHLAQIKGFGGSPPGNKFPLQLCQGDCDDDSDCDEGLVCLKRSANDPVPGCSGNLGSNTDYCVAQGSNSQSNTAAQSNTRTQSAGQASGTFRLKLYWEDGYDWQGEYVERKWCMMYDYDGSKRINGNCWYGASQGSCNDDQVYIEKCSDDNRQRFRFVHIDGSDEVLIKTAGGGKSSGLCFQRDTDTDVFLRQCDANHSRQRWYAVRGGFDERRFEISQRTGNQFSRDQCMTQAHHPKTGEVIELFACTVARSKNHLTSYWNTY